MYYLSSSYTLPRTHSLDKIEEKTRSQPELQGVSANRRATANDGVVSSSKAVRLLSMLLVSLRRMT